MWASERIRPRERRLSNETSVLPAVDARVSHLPGYLGGPRVLTSRTGQKPVSRAAALGGGGTGGHHGVRVPQTDDSGSTRPSPDRASTSRRRPGWEPRRPTAPAALAAWKKRRGRRASRPRAADLSRGGGAPPGTDEAPAAELPDSAAGRGQRQNLLPRQQPERPAVRRRHRRQPGLPDAHGGRLLRRAARHPDGRGYPSRGGRRQRRRRGLRQIGAPGLRPDLLPRPLRRRGRLQPALLRPQRPLRRGERPFHRRHRRARRGLLHRRLGDRGPDGGLEPLLHPLGHPAGFLRLPAGRGRSGSIYLGGTTFLADGTTDGPVLAIRKQELYAGTPITVASARSAPRPSRSRPTCTASSRGPGRASGRTTSSPTTFSTVRPTASGPGTIPSAAAGSPSRG